MPRHGSGLQVRIAGCVQAGVRLPKTTRRPWLEHYACDQVVAAASNLDPKGFASLNAHGGQYRPGSGSAKLAPQRAQRRTAPVARVREVSSRRLAQLPWPVRMSALVGHKATQRPQSSQRDALCSSAKSPEPESPCWRVSAPVGQTRTQTPQAVHPVASRLAHGHNGSSVALGAQPLRFKHCSAATTRLLWSRCTSGTQQWSSPPRNNSLRRDSGRRLSS